MPAPAGVDVSQAPHRPACLLDHPAADCVRAVAHPNRWRALGAVQAVPGGGDQLVRGAPAGSALCGQQQQLVRVGVRAACVEARLMWCSLAACQVLQGACLPPCSRTFHVSCQYCSQHAGTREVASWSRHSGCRLPAHCCHPWVRPHCLLNTCSCVCCRPPPLPLLLSLLLTSDTARQVACCLSGSQACKPHAVLLHDSAGVLCDVEEFFFFHIVSRSARTQVR